MLNICKLTIFWVVDLNKNLHVVGAVPQYKWNDRLTFLCLVILVGGGTEVKCNNKAETEIFDS